MMRSFRSELLKLRRPSIIAGGGAVLAGFTVLATVLTFTTATATGQAAQNGRYATSTFASLASANGLTRGFANAAGLLGIVVFVLFLTSMTSEYNHGTLRMLLTRQPRRARLLGGKFLALVAVTAAAMVAALLLSAAAAIPLAHSQGIATTGWLACCCAQPLWLLVWDWRGCCRWKTSSRTPGQAQGTGYPACCSAR